MKKVLIFGGTGAIGFNIAKNLKNQGYNPIIIARNEEDLINKSKEILDKDKLDIDEQEILNEISIGKLSSTVFLGRLKVLTKKIKNDSLKKTLMNLGYMIYTVSLQSKSLKNIEDTLSKLNQTIQKQQIETQRLNNKK